MILIKKKTPLNVLKSWKSGEIKCNSFFKQEDFVSQKSMPVSAA